MTQTYKVQVSMNQAHIVESGFVWKQGDFGFNIEIEVLDFDTTGATPQIIFRKSTGAVEATTITRDGNKFTYAIRGTELDTPGPCVCDLKLNDSTTKRVSTASFKYFVIPDTMDGLEQEASSYSDTIEEIASTLQGYSEDSEAWAKGTVNGTPVPSTAEQYKNNSKYYSDMCAEATGELSNEVEILGAKIGALNGYNELKYFIPESHTGNYWAEETEVNIQEGDNFTVTFLGYEGTAFSSFIVEGYRNGGWGGVHTFSQNAEEEYTTTALYNYSKLRFTVARTSNEIPASFSVLLKISEGEGFGKDYWRIINNLNQINPDITNLNEETTGYNNIIFTIPSSWSSNTWYEEIDANIKTDDLCSIVFGGYEGTAFSSFVVEGYRNGGWGGIHTFSQNTEEEYIFTSLYDYTKLRFTVVRTSNEKPASFSVIIKSNNGLGLGHDYTTIKQSVLELESDNVTNKAQIASNTSNIEVLQEDISENVGGDSENLYNPQTDTTDIVILSNGNVDSNTSFKTSDFIEVPLNSVVYVKSAASYLGTDGATFVAIYDSQKGFLARADAYAMESGAARISWTGIKFIRICMAKQATPFMANTGTGLHEYVPYGFNYSDKLKTEMANISAEVVQPINTTIKNNLGEISENLYDFDTDTQNIVILSDGTLNPNTSFRTSEYIELPLNGHISVKSATNYLGKDGATFVGIYNANKEFLARADAYAKESGAADITWGNIKYIRVCSAVDSNPFMVNLGSTLHEYKPYGFNYSTDFVNEVEEIANEIINKEPTYYWSTQDIPQEGTCSDFEGIATTDPTLSELYGMYDALVTNYPDYISKTDLGLDESETYHIYKYSFVPESISVFDVTYDMPKKPKVLYGSGIHGNGEHGDHKEMVVGLYYFFKNICDNWKDDPALAYLRWNVQFEVIPVENPWGYVNLNRRNSNLVDLNRNFPYGWRSGTQGAVDYGGAAPLTEAESIIMNQFIQNNKDALFFCDWHTTGGIPTQDRMIYFDMIGNMPFSVIANDVVISLSEKWNKENIGGLTDDPMHGYIYGENPMGCLNHWALHEGIPACTLEGFPNFQYSTETYEGDKIMEMCLDEIMYFTLSSLKYFHYYKK